MGVGDQLEIVLLFQVRNDSDCLEAVEKMRNRYCKANEWRKVVGLADSGSGVEGSRGGEG